MRYNQSEMKIYLDACCLNRPFDDQIQDRIRLESEAVLIILRRFESGAWEWVSSDVLDTEIEHAPDAEKKARVQLLAGFAHQRIELQESDLDRVEQLEKLGIKGFDALHIACAERSGCEVFLTTDDCLLSASTRNAKELRIQVLNPLDWMKKVMKE